jgi:hydrogenase 3 maturation protease
VDAADIKQKAGTVLLLNAEELAEGVSFSTHKLPPKVMIDYFTRRIGCKTLIIGIQPKTLKFDSPVSKEVKSSAREVSGAIISAIKGAD